MNTNEAPVMTEVRRRMIAAREQLLADPSVKMTKAQRAEMERQLAAWKASGR